METTGRQSDPREPIGQPPGALEAGARLAVCVRNLHKAYRNGNVIAPVLNGVELAVERGQCVYLAGPSGMRPFLRFVNIRVQRS
ncbi:MAG: hypothetical protein NUV77_18260 [Thermoguttaceae bacterium]|nr:hypothetical protein [Thermoguttaceae bacterium]